MLEQEKVIAATISLDGEVLRLFRVLKLFPSVGINVAKHYTTMGVHKSFPQGVVSLVILRDCYPMNVRLK